MIDRNGEEAGNPPKCRRCGSAMNRVSPSMIAGVEKFWFMCKLHGAEEFRK